MAFEPGDVVMLKSGSDPMTVVSAEEDQIECVWVNEGGRFFRETIPAVALESLDALRERLGRDDDDEDDLDDDDDLEDDEDEEGEDDDEEEDEDDEEDEPSKARRKVA